MIRKYPNLLTFITIAVTTDGIFACTTGTSLRYPQIPQQRNSYQALQYTIQKTGASFIDKTKQAHEDVCTDLAPKHVCTLVPKLLQSRDHYLWAPVPVL